MNEQVIDFLRRYGYKQLEPCKKETPISIEDRLKRLEAELKVEGGG